MYRAKLTFAVLCCLLTTSGHGQDALPAPLEPVVVRPQAELIGRPDLAVKMAADDLRKLAQVDPAQAANSWYVWLRDAKDTELLEAYDYVLNTGMSRALVPLRSTRVRNADGERNMGVLLRLDLREWLPEPEHMRNFDFIVEQQVDPSFYVDLQDIAVDELTLANAEFIVSPDLTPVFRDQVFAGIDAQGRYLFNVEPYSHQGAQYTKDAVPLRPGTTVPIFGPAIQAIAYQDALDLLTITGRRVPIVEGERWLEKSLRTLDNGLYYKLRGVEKTDGTRLNLDQWLARYGADQQASAALGGQEFVGMWLSNVTGNPRRAVFLYGNALRPSAGPPLIVITQDGSDESNETDEHPMKSLRDFNFVASEVMAITSSGVIDYALFDSDGNLQDEAPPNVVSDHTIPRPHTKRLEPGISCIRCHAPHDQWQPMANHVKRMFQTPLTTKNGQETYLKILFQLANQRKEDAQKASGSSKAVANQQAKAQGAGAAGQAAAESAPSYDALSISPRAEAVINDLSEAHDLDALYTGDLTLALELARDSHMRFCRQVAPNANREGPDHGRVVVDIVSDRFHRQVFQSMTPREALRTLGLAATAEEASKIFESVVPLAVSLNHGDATLVDPTVAALHLYDTYPDMPIRREDWDVIYQSVFAAAVQTGAVPLDIPVPGAQPNEADEEATQP